ncbi:DUF1707 domain-containing protein [Streptomyces sp. NBRC 109706]|uniref:DUF1707 SHOCT-like domain-containing protein n=1 Tax=Streptomyces sp. NBRC 109706 TaxID=1550035 RepID=UPI000ACAA6ED
MSLEKQSRSMEKQSGPPAAVSPVPSGPSASAEEASAASPAVPAAGPKSVRASDADRDRIADILRDALAEGRLEPEEHAERLDALYRSKTIGELEPLINDLPAGQRASASPSLAPAQGPAGVAQRAPGGPPAAPEAKNVVAVFGGATRKGTWRVGAKINAVAVCGGVDLDFTEAIFDQQHVVLNVVAFWGGVDIKVPENVTLRSGGSGIMGGFEVHETESPDPRAPVITVQGVAIMGGLEAKAVPGKRLRDLSAD